MYDTVIATPALSSRRLRDYWIVCSPIIRPPHFAQSMDRQTLTGRDGGVGKSNWPSLAMVCGSSNGLKSSLWYNALSLIASHQF